MITISEEDRTFLKLKYGINVSYTQAFIYVKLKFDQDLLNHLSSEGYPAVGYRTSRANTESAIDIVFARKTKEAHLERLFRTLQEYMK